MTIDDAALLFVALLLCGGWGYFSGIAHGLQLRGIERWLREAVHRDGGARLAYQTVRRIP